MAGFPRPRLVVSRCLGFDACRYDGETVPCPFLAKLERFADLIPVCPEVEIGLGTPRDPIRLARRNGEPAPRLLQPSTGLDLTERMRAFRAEYLDGVGDPDGFVLKSRSPSCAIRDAKLYSDREDAPAGLGPGMFAEEVLRRFPDSAIEDERRLANPRIRQRFLTRIGVRHDNCPE